jgi:hypothetical protein
VVTLRNSVLAPTVPHHAPGPLEPLCVPQAALGETPGRPRIAYEQGGLCGGLESRCFPASETQNHDEVTFGHRLFQIDRTANRRVRLLGECLIYNQASWELVKAAGRAEPGCLAAGEEAAGERYFTWDQPKAARELSRAALEMNCRVSPVPFLLTN